MPRHRTAGGRRPFPVPPAQHDCAHARQGGAHRAPALTARHGKIVLAAAATAGTLAATGAPLNPSGVSPDADLQSPVLDGGTGAAPPAVGGADPVTSIFRPQLLAAARPDTGQLDRLSRAEQLAAERAARDAAARAEAERIAREAAEQSATQAREASNAAARREAEARSAREAAARQAAAREAAAREATAREAEARRPRFVAPTVGRLTSTYGSRWGTMHWGIDMANRIGTPIVSVADGVVVEAGPASGFGLWVRVRHSDATITVYGHVDRTLVRAGQVVRAGQQIATMGNRGQSTGPHLHLEVWTAGGAKINPLTWLRARGVAI